METSAIRYRVADFLRQHPPFDAFSETDRLALVAHGRVRFHEEGEYLYWQGRPHGPHVYVIQQGSASLWDESGPTPRLVDVRGPGDLLGVDRLLGQEAHRHSARALADLVLYALPAVDFEPFLARYPAAALYLAAHFTVSAHPDPADPDTRAHEKTARDLLRPDDRVTVHARDTLSQAAERMLRQGVSAAAVVDDAGRLTGLLEPGTLLAALSRAALDAGTPVAHFLEAAPPGRPLPATAPLDDCLFALAGAEAVAVTDDPARPGRPAGVLTRAGVASVLAKSPIDALRDAARADHPGALRSANQRLRSFLLDQLGTPAAVDFAARLASRFDRLVVERILSRTAADEPRGGPEPEPDLVFLFGASGRGESLTALPPQVGFVHAEGDPARERARGRLTALEDALRESGYLSPGAANPDAFQFRCATLAEWRERFRSWTEDPVVNRLHAARPLFDMVPLRGPEAAWHALAEGVRASAERDDFFLRLLAHDCLSRLPPLSFFRDVVIEETGERNEVLHLEQSALRPLVDVGRVFGIASGRPLGGSTLERLERAAAFRPRGAELFREAAETFRVLLFHQSRAGLRRGDAGFEVLPQSLSRHDRRVLKTSFRAIARLLEFTGEGDWLRA